MLLGSILCVCYSVWNIGESPSIYSILKNLCYANQGQIQNTQVRVSPGVHQQIYGVAFWGPPSPLSLRYLLVSRASLFRPLARNCHLSYYVGRTERKGEKSLGFGLTCPLGLAVPLHWRFPSLRMLSPIVFLYCYAPATGLPGNKGKREQKERITEEFTLLSLSFRRSILCSLPPN